ncbi:MAG: GIY-YIG nuclease family protein [Acidobacteriota bacterium]|nr:GIY-YIG nuclease family protein [Acidobacteriota bacterium]
MPFVYLLRCVDSTLYVGHTHDLAARAKAHNDGHGSAYTASRRPVTMVYAEEHSTLPGAVTREHQLKRWTQAKKQALIDRRLAPMNAPAPRGRRCRTRQHP